MNNITVTISRFDTVGQTYDSVISSISKMLEFAYLESISTDLNHIKHITELVKDMYFFGKDSANLNVLKLADDAYRNRIGFISVSQNGQSRNASLEIKKHFKGDIVLSLNFDEA